MPAKIETVERHVQPCYCDECEAGRIQDEREARAEEREADRVRMAWHDAHPGHMHPPVWR
jgi:hypothetical protein